MTDIQLHKKIDMLPENLRKEVSDFVEELFQKAKTALKKEEKPIRKAGIAKGMVVYMAEDFDEPLEDFKDYM